MSDEPDLRTALDLSGRVAIVTGGTRGIGRGIAQRFLEAGADVVVCARHEPESLPEGGGRTALFLTTDVRDPEQAEALVAATVERHGAVDILVNNAGGSPPSDSATAPATFTKRIVELNLLAAIYCAQAANRVMQAQEGGGVIINIGSVSGMRPTPMTMAYGAAKAGLVNITETLAVEWAPKVRVVGVAGGLVVTELAHLFYGDEEGIASVGRTIPLGRMATPIDIADVCLFAVSPLARYVTGVTIVAHGGGERPAYIDAAKNIEPGR